MKHGITVWESVERCTTEPRWRRWLRKVTGSAPAEHELIAVNNVLHGRIASLQAQLQVYRETISVLDLELAKRSRS